MYATFFACSRLWRTFCFVLLHMCVIDIPVFFFFHDLHEGGNTIFQLKKYLCREANRPPPPKKKIKLISPRRSESSAYASRISTLEKKKMRFNLHIVYESIEYTYKYYLYATLVSKYRSLVGSSVSLGRWKDGRFYSGWRSAFESVTIRRQW